MKNGTILMNNDFLDAASALPKEIKSKLFKVLSYLASNVRHPSLQCKKIKGSKGSLYECRVDQQIRLIYDLSSQGIRCWYVGAHDMALKVGESMDELIVEDVMLSDIDPLISQTITYLNTGNIATNYFSLKSLSILEN